MMIIDALERCSGMVTRKYSQQQNYTAEATTSLLKSNEHIVGATGKCCLAAAQHTTIQTAQGGLGSGVWNLHFGQAIRSI